MTLTGYIVGTKGNTGRGIASIVENADYTITINLTDGSSYTTAPIAGFTAVEFDENYDLVVTKTDGTTETVETDIADYNALLKGYKDDAETAATNANTYQGWAQDYASNAQAQAGYASTYKQAAYDSQVAAGTSESNAGTQALKSEGYAVGKQNGTDVSSGSDYYHNNAKYYSDMAHIDATDASDSQSSASGSASTASAQALKSEGYAVGKQNGTDVTSGSDYYQNNSKYYKEQAATSASSASTNALKAEGFAVGEQNGTAVSSGSPYYENNAEYYAGEAADSATAAAASAASLVIEDALDEDSTNALENGVITKEFAKKANIDGAYEAMTVGNAEQLVSTVFVNDEEPYNFRTAGGSADIGDREYDTIVGGTVAWNQQTVGGNFSNITYWSKGGSNVINCTIANNICDVEVLKVDFGYNYGQTIYQPMHLPQNHKVFVSADFKPTYTHPAGFYIIKDFNISGGYNSSWYDTCTAGKWNTVSKIMNLQSGISSFQVQFNMESTYGYAVGDTDQCRNVMLIDLTQMFGSAIADYIHSLETATAGAGVAWFKKLFPKDYYAYNAGELMSVKALRHITRGFNAWDEEWESGYYSRDNGTKAGNSTTTYFRSKNFIPCLPSTTYYIKQPAVHASNSTFCGLLFYDADQNYISARTESTSRTFTTPSNAYYMTFYIEVGTSGATYQHDICINLHWDGERDGEYEEYVKHSYALDSDLVLRGIPKLDASNNLYYDGDTYASDGSVTRKYGIVDMGTLDWIYVSSATRPYFRTQTDFASIKPSEGSGTKAPMVCSKYPVETWTHVLDTDGYDKNICEGWKDRQFIAIRDDSYTDATTFKTAMSGVYLVYELATPTTETADPFQSPQIVDDFGTEEYVDYAMSEGDRDVAIPVGHITKYTNNLRAKLEMSPNSPDGAGDYLVRQTNGINTYVPYVNPVPTPPTTDGNYVLKATVASGVATLAWVSE